MAARKTTSPAKAEVQDELEGDVVDTVTFTFSFGKHEVDLTCVTDIGEADPEAYLAYQRKDYMELMKWLLGEFQWNMLRQMGFKSKHIPSLFTAWSEATGAGEG